VAERECERDSWARFSSEMRQGAAVEWESGAVAISSRWEWVCGLLCGSGMRIRFDRETLVLAAEREDEQPGEIYELVSVPIALGVGERERYQALRGRFASSYAAFQRAMPHAAWREYVRDASQTLRGRAALAAWREYRSLLAYPDGKRVALHEILRRHRGSRALVFTADNATAYAIARELLIMPITCEIRRSERTQAIAGFRSGECPVLVSSQVLEDGFDVPDAELAIVVGRSGSQRRHVQRVGRVLRPRDGKRAVVYELAVSETIEVAAAARRRAGLGGSQVIDQPAVAGAIGGAS
jgi:superfamily II DNA or RNA helicase